jgi:broad specificity phosphatase PhoE
VVHPTWGRPLSERPSPIPDGLDGALVLVRHGQSRLIAEGRFQGQMDSPLTDVGLAQADAVARRLADRRRPPVLPVPVALPHEIVHSPLARTAATADRIAAAMGGSGAGPTSTGSSVPTRGEPGFLEIAQGDWEGLTGAEIGASHAESLAAWRRRPWDHVAPGGETLQAVAARVGPALGRLLGDLAAGREAGTLDRSHVAGYGDAPPDHPWTVLVGHDGVFKIALLTLFELPLERFWMWSMDLCGISVIEFRAGRPVLRAHNLTDHLAALQAASPGPADDPSARPEGAL